MGVTASDGKLYVFGGDAGNVSCLCLKWLRSRNDFETRGVWGCLVSVCRKLGGSHLQARSAAFESRLYSGQRCRVHFMHRNRVIWQCPWIHTHGCKLIRNSCSFEHSYWINEYICETGALFNSSSGSIVCQRRVVGCHNSGPDPSANFQAARATNTFPNILAARGMDDNGGIDDS